MSLFHYVTYKYIIIKDKRLGIAYYTLATVILLYTCVQIVVNKAYLKFDYSPRGSLRLLVSTPPLKDAIQPSYCNDTSACKRLDGLTLNWPVESRAATLATYVKEIIEEKNCGEDIEIAIADTMNSHTLYTVLSHNEYYTLYPEEALMKIEHSIASSGNSLSSSHRKMTGVLMGKDGKVLKILNSRDSSRVDKLRLADFLNSANVSLGTLSDAMNAQGRTFRKNGLVLRVTIDYRNADSWWFGVGDIEYKYYVRHLTFSDYRVKQELPIALPDGKICKRIVNKRYAVRLEFDQAGKIGEYCLPTLLLQLVSLMGLLTLTATIIDVIALYLVPDKSMYRQYVFDASPELQKAEEADHKKME